MSQVRPIEIHPVLNGWLAKIGCQTVVFTDKRTMLNELDSYYANPTDTEERFLKNAVNKVESIARQADTCNTMAPEPCGAQETRRR